MGRTFKNRLQSFVDGIGGMFAPLDAAAHRSYDEKPLCVQAYSEQSEEITEALYDLSEENDRVKRMLERAMEAGGWGAVLVAMQPVATAAWQHHVMRPEPESDTETDVDGEPTDNGDGELTPDTRSESIDVFNEVVAQAQAEAEAEGRADA